MWCGVVSVGVCDGWCDVVYVCVMGGVLCMCDIVECVHWYVWVGVMGSVVCTCAWRVVCE